MDSTEDAGRDASKRAEFGGPRERLRSATQSRTRKLARQRPDDTAVRAAQR
jgi:hypothetical protein